MTNTEPFVRPRTASERRAGVTLVTPVVAVAIGGSHSRRTHALASNGRRWCDRGGDPRFGSGVGGPVSFPVDCPNCRAAVRRVEQ